MCSWEEEGLSYPNNVFLCVHFALSMYDNKQLLSVDDSAPSAVKETLGFTPLEIGNALNDFLSTSYPFQTLDTSLVLLHLAHLDTLHNILD